MNELVHTSLMLTAGSPTRISGMTGDSGGAAPAYSWEPTNTDEPDPYFNVQSPVATAGGLWESPAVQPSDRSL